MGLQAGGRGVAPAEGVSPEFLADPEPAAAIGRLVILALVTVAHLVVERVENEPFFGPDPVVQLVDQDGHIRRLADRLRAKDRQMPRPQRADRVGQGVMAFRAKPQIRRPPTFRTIRGRWQEEPVEMATKAPSGVRRRVGPPGSANRRPCVHMTRAVQGAREDRVIDHPGEVGLAVVALTAQVHRVSRESLEAERAPDRPPRREPLPEVDRHEAPRIGHRSAAISHQPSAIVGEPCARFKAGS